MRSFKDQLDMIANLADAVFTGHLLASKTASIVERVKKLSEVRNRIIHGRWIYLHNVSSDGATVTTILRVMRTASEMDTFVAVAGGWPSDDRARLRQSIRDKKIFNKKKLLEHKEQFREMCAHLARLNDEIIGRA
jgi:hypothetical protein